LPTLLAASLADPRLLVGLAGVALAAAGSRFYRVAVIAPGFAIGAVGAAELLGKASFTMRTAAMVGAGLVLGLLFHFVERAAILLTGLVVGAVGTWLFSKGVHSLPMWAPAAGGLGGLLFFPTLYNRLLPFTTALMGALCIAWAAGKVDSALFIGGITFAGLVIQSIGGKSS
jgi:hypothetical protein